MRVGILGSGTVGRTITAKLIELGHEVLVGTRNPSSTLAHGEPDASGNPPFGVWQQQNPRVKLGTLEQAAAHGEIVFNATAGVNSLEALEMAGHNNLSGKILIDVASPLDFSQGAPPHARDMQHRLSRGADPAGPPRYPGCEDLHQDRKTGLTCFSATYRASCY